MPLYTSSHNPIGLQGLLRDSFTFFYLDMDLYVTAQLTKPLIYVMLTKIETHVG
jgi:hypothetical protein